MSDRRHYSQEPVYPEIVDSLMSRFNDLLAQRTAPGLAGHAHLLVDQQRFYCDPSYNKGNGTKKTDAIARRNATLVEEFRKLGITNYLIYTGRKNSTAHGTRGGLYLIEPQDGDVTIRKNTNSAFVNTKLYDELIERGQKSIWVTGFNSCACVKDTIQQAVLSRYEVNLITTNTACDGAHTGSSRGGYTSKALKLFESASEVNCYTMDEALDYLRLIAA